MILDLLSLSNALGSRLLCVAVYGEDPDPEPPGTMALDHQAFIRHLNDAIFLLVLNSIETGAEPVQAKLNPSCACWELQPYPPKGQSEMSPQLAILGFMVASCSLQLTLLPLQGPYV